MRTWRRSQVSWTPPRGEGVQLRLGFADLRSGGAESSKMIRCRFLVAEHDGRLLGGLLAYRQGGHWATAFSADDATMRNERPGTMHMLRWTAIRMARDDGAPTIDLGGVDVPGARRLPTPGEPQWGMYEHKIGFGARWVESAGAH